MPSVRVYRERDKWVIENCLGTSIPHRHFCTTFVDSSATGLPGCTDKKVIANRARAAAWQKKYPRRYKVRYRNWRKSHLAEKAIFDRWYRETHREITRANHRRWKYLHPTYVSLRARYDSIRARCNREVLPSYKYYGGRGIKCLLTWNEFLLLWKRDKAYRLSQPSLDRIDNDGHYSITNCRFIELTENSRKRYVERGRVFPTFWDKVKMGLIKIERT